MNEKPKYTLTVSKKELELIIFSLDVRANSLEHKTGEEYRELANKLDGMQNPRND